MIPVLIAPKIERSSATTTYLFTLTAAVAVGQPVVVRVGGVFPSGTTVTCVDSRSNAYEQRNLTVSNTTSTAIFTTTATTALLVGDTITVTQSNSVANGFGTAHSLDVGATYVGQNSGINNNAGPTDSGTVAVDGDPHTFLDIVMTSRGSSTANVVTHASPWVEDQNGQSGTTTRKWYGTSSRTSSSAGSYGHTSTLPVSGAWSDSMVVFKDPAAGPPPAGTVAHVWPGNLTATTARVVSKTSAATSVRLAVSTSSGMTSLTYVAAQTPDGEGRVTHAATGLTANTRYYVQLADTPSGGSESLIGPVSTFRTPQTAGTAVATRKIVLGACVRTSSSTPAALNDAVTWAPDYGLFVGDLTYGGSSSTSAATHRGTYDTQLANVSALRSLLQAGGAAFYLASDHDTSNIDNADSNDATGAAALSARKSVTPMTGYTTTTEQQWDDGRVSFYAIDIRTTDRSTGSSTDNSGKTMLGSAQLARVLDWLANNPAPWKVIVGDTAWMGAADSVNKTDWWPAYTTERQTLINAIATQLAAGKMVEYWHGDSHLIGYATPAKNTWGSFPVLCAAGFDQDGGGRNTSTFSAFWNNSSGAVTHYGRVTFTDDGTTITRAFSGWDATGGVERVNNVQTLNTSAPVNLVVPDVSHAQAAETPALTQVHVLTVGDSSHAHTAEAATLTQAHALAVPNASHAHTTDVPALAQVHALAVPNTTHAHAADAVSLTQQHALTVGDATHAHAAEQVALSGAGALGIGDSTHAHTAQGITLTQAHVLTVGDALHGHVADTLSLSPALAISNATHAHAAQAVALTQVHVLSVQDASHPHVATLIVLTTEGDVVIIPPAARTFPARFGVREFPATFRERVLQ